MWDEQKQEEKTKREKDENSRIGENQVVASNENPYAKRTIWPQRAYVKPTLDCGWRVPNVGAANNRFQKLMRILQRGAEF